MTRQRRTCMSMSLLVLVMNSPYEGHHSSHRLCRADLMEQGKVHLRLLVTQVKRLSSCREAFPLYITINNSSASGQACTCYQQAVKDRQCKEG